ncbi:MAG: electron transport protein [Bacillales bacterium]|nr:electron transport protein [Bacillales bacterium]
MEKKAWFIAITGFIILIAAIVSFIDLEYAYVPDQENTISSYRNVNGYDWYGQTFSLSEGRAKKLSEKNGAVKVNYDLFEKGRNAFYKETFGNEVFLTDIVGILDGPLTAPHLMKALITLKGAGTTNLKVELANDMKIGGQSFKKGQLISTGLDVPKGSFAPLGMPVSFSNGELKAGISCAACHATVDRETKRVVEGAPNSDLNAGLLLALAPNTAAYFTHANISNFSHFLQKQGNLKLPNKEKLEESVDKTLLLWPPGNFDSTIDLKGNPAQIPSSFTFQNFPYSWSGFGMAGSFHGLTVFNNNVHAQNSDSLSQADIAKPLFGIEKETYLGTILQNAANPTFRFDPRKGKSPSSFFAKVDPTPDAPGINELVKPPTFPKVSPVAPDGFIVSSPGFHFNEQNNAMSAFQNAIIPPKSKINIRHSEADAGYNVFSKAGCISCHAGSYLTNHKIVPADEIGTEPSRAKALAKTAKIFAEPLLYSPAEKVPIRQNARVLKAPMDSVDEQQLRLGFAHDGKGGYKTPSLIGLYWQAPYLHDGGVAVGYEHNYGLTGTLLKGKPVDPYRSIIALVDRKERQKVIAANFPLHSVHITGDGHSFWVDQESGFTKNEQKALAKYLLSLNEGRMVQK